MCGRYGFTSEIDDVKERFDILNWLDDIYEREDGYNIGPGSSEPVIVRNSPNSAVRMKWGYTLKSKNPAKRPLFIFNARKDKLESFFLYKIALSSKRCIIPMNYFVEWLTIGEGKDKEKYPFIYKVKGEKMFSMAGLYFVDKDAEGKEMKYFVIITVDPNELVGKVHDRLGAILDKKDEERWLNPTIKDPKVLLSMLKPFPSEKMEAYAVSQEINSTRNEGSQLIQKIDSPYASYASL